MDIPPNNNIIFLEKPITKVEEIRLNGVKINFDYNKHLIMIILAKKVVAGDRLDVMVFQQEKMKTYQQYVFNRAVDPVSCPSCNSVQINKIIGNNCTIFYYKCEDCGHSNGFVHAFEVENCENYSSFIWCIVKRRWNIRGKERKGERDPSFLRLS